MRTSIKLFSYHANHFKMLINSIAEQLDTPRQNRLIHNKLTAMQPYLHTLKRFLNENSTIENEIYDWAARSFNMLCETIIELTLIACVDACKYSDYQPNSFVSLMHDYHDPSPPYLNIPGSLFAQKQIMPATQLMMAYEHTVSKIRNILLANQLFSNETKLISEKQTELAVNNERFLFDVYVGKAVSANHIHQEPITRLYCDGQDTIEEMNITATLATARGLAFSHHQNLNELLAKSPTRILRDVAKEIAFGYAMRADYKSAQHYMQKFHIEAKEIEKLFLSTNDQQAAQRFKNHLEKSSINTDQKAGYTIIEVENIASNVYTR